MKYLLTFILIIVFYASNAQCKTFKLNSQGDTLNCIDKNDKKQGKWVIKVEQLRGEKGYEEEGEFLDDAKEGIWRRYTEIGDFIALENYKWGNKNGVQQYFTIYGLEHEECWRAINPNNPFDTVWVPDVNNPDKYEMKIVKVATTCVKNGNFRYYDPTNGTLLRTESYLFDKLQEAKAGNQSGNKASNDVKELPSENASKPKEVIQFEKKIANAKKKIKIRTGDVKIK